jgi:hypothetical protein
MKSSIAIAAALVLTSLVLNPGSAAARGGGHGQIGSSHGPVGGGHIGQGATRMQPAFRGRSLGYGPGWCYWHPYACYHNSSRF